MFVQFIKNNALSNKCQIHYFFFFNFAQNVFLLTDYNESFPYQISQKSVRLEPICYMWTGRQTGGRTDMTKPIRAWATMWKRVKMLATYLVKTFRLLLKSKLKFLRTDGIFYWEVTRGAVWQSFTSVTEKRAVSSVSVFSQIYTTVDCVTSQKTVFLVVSAFSTTDFTISVRLSFSAPL